MAETLHTKNPEQQAKRDHELEAIRDASRERARTQFERERTPEKSVEAVTELRHEARELAKNHERDQPKAERESLKAERERRHDQPISKTERTKAYKNVMAATQAQMSAPTRTFSKVIHNPVVEKTSEVIGNTVARPDAVLSGSVCALVLVLGVYAIARFYGYPLSGFETIGAFIVGWILGIIYDFLHAMITGHAG